MPDACDEMKRKMHCCKRDISAQGWVEVWEINSELNYARCKLSRKIASDRLSRFCYIILLAVKIFPEVQVVLVSWVCQLHRARQQHKPNNNNNNKKQNRDGCVKKPESFWMQIYSLIPKMLKTNIQLKSEPFLLRLMDMQLGNIVFISGNCSEINICSKAERLTSTQKWLLKVM